MEVDEIQQQQHVYKFQKLSSDNGNCTDTSNPSIPQKIAATSTGNLVLQNHVDDDARLYGWPSSRIVRVSRASGGKDRHSKVLTSKGLRDRRVRLSVGTAIQFYDLQDRLGYDQPSKAVEWLLKAASSSIDELPSLDLPFSVAGSNYHQIGIAGGENKATRNISTDVEDRIYKQQSSSTNNNDNNNHVCGGSCSSTSETSKGSGLSLSRSENRMKARERARLLLAFKKEKDKGTDSNRLTGLNHNQNQVNSISENSSFTDLLTGGINTTTTTTGRSAIDHYFFNRPPQVPQFNIMTGDNLHHFSLPQDSLLPTVTTTFGGGGRVGELHNFNFLATSPSLSGGGAIAPGGFTRGTLQSNLQLQSSLLPHHQRFQSSLVEGSSNLPVFIVPNATADHFTATAGGYHLGYGGGGDGGGRNSDHHKDKSKN